MKEALAFLSIKHLRFARSSSCAKVSSEFRNEINLPVANKTPLFMASYIPLSSSEIIVTRGSSDHIFKICNVSSEEAPSIIMCS